MRPSTGKGVCALQQGAQEFTVVCPVIAMGPDGWLRYNLSCSLPLLVITSVQQKSILVHTWLRIASQYEWTHLTSANSSKYQILSSQNILCGNNFGQALLSENVYRSKILHTRYAMRVFY